MRLPIYGGIESGVTIASVMEHGILDGRDRLAMSHRGRPTRSGRPRRKVLAVRLVPRPAKKVLVVRHRHPWQPGTLRTVSDMRTREVVTRYRSQGVFAARQSSTKLHAPLAAGRTLMQGFSGQWPRYGLRCPRPFQVHRALSSLPACRVGSGTS